ncbi:MAG TPA: hypothetical protein VKP11_01690 [Frankiaceae bacterium]|nr:hypothetical protein [Frankiaceae bacterium]
MPRGRIYWAPAAPFSRQLGGDLHGAHATGLAPSPARWRLRAPLLLPVVAVRSR